MTFASEVEERLTVGPAVWVHKYDVIVPSGSVLEEPFNVTVSEEYGEG